MTYPEKGPCWGREGGLKQDVRADPRPVAKLSHADQASVRKLAECHSLKGATVAITQVIIPRKVDITAPR